MILIIAEKPSLARNIAAGIGPMQKRNGYAQCEKVLGNYNKVAINEKKFSKKWPSISKW